MIEYLTIFCVPNQARGLKVTCLLCYCSEGDNMPDSFQLAEAASKVVGLTDSNIQGEWFFELLSFFL